MMPPPSSSVSTHVSVGNIMGQRFTNNQQNACWTCYVILLLVNCLLRNISQCILSGLSSLNKTTMKLTFSSSHFIVCKTCIVNYFEDESNPRCCPICDTAVSKNRPMQSLREDKLKQDIVYKLVPQVFKSKCAVVDSVGDFWNSKTR